MNKINWTEEAIIKGIKTKGPLWDKALKYIFKELDWRGFVMQHVLNNGGQISDAEEVAQDTLIAFDRNIRNDAFKRDSKLKSYFMGIAKRIWLKQIRDRKKFDEIKPEHFEKEVMSIEYHLINEEKKQFWDILLAKIGERCKTILKLQQLGYSLKEIAKEVNMTSDKMTKKEAHRCRTKIRILLNDNPSWKDLIR